MLAQMRLCAVVAAAAATIAAAAPPTKHNILFLAADDMRPEMSPYGFEYMHTPNFQGLAEDGYVFRRTYVQQALCAPSRTVLLTSRRPDSSRVWAIGPYFRETTGRNYTTLPQFFKRHGYRALGHGKIFHEGNASGFPLDQDQMFGSWSVPYFHPSDPYDRCVNAKPPCDTAHGVHTPLSHGPIDEPWQSFNDAKSALTAVEWIKNASLYEDPFFLAVGFHRPHIPYVYPKEFEFNGTVEFPPENYFITRDVPPVAPHDWTGEGNGYEDLHDIKPSIVAHDFQANLSSLCSAVPLGVQHDMKKSYYSCIQYIDHLVGVLVGALKDEELYDSTTIIFWGDHGYKLGEHCDWFKHDNYEDSTRIPVLLKPAAGILDAATALPPGSFVEALVEEVDMFPSLADLAGLGNAVSATGAQGTSWVPLLRDAGGAAEKEAVFSQYPHHSQMHDMECMGYSMRTAEWRYTEWVPFKCSTMHPMSDCATDSEATPHWGSGLCGVELYNHTGDPSTDFHKYENENLAGRPDLADLVANLSARLHNNWAPPAP